MLFFPAPIHERALQAFLGRPNSEPFPALEFSDFRVTPHYPAKSPLNDVLRKVAPGADEYVSEKYAFEIEQLLDEWGRALKAGAAGFDVLAKFLEGSLEGCSLVPIEQSRVRSDYGIEIFRRKFGGAIVAGRDHFLQEIKTYLASMPRVQTAEFEITGIEEVGALSPMVRVEVRYELAGVATDGKSEQRIGQWRTHWSHDDASGWRARRWEATEETLCRARAPLFADITSHALGQTESYKQQLLHGVDYWRTVMDGACGLDIYGNNGVAAGDFDKDGLDGLYICQPAGLPNRLYRNRGDGTFEDVTEKAGVGVLDGTACALFVDFENKGLQDLLVVCGSGPLLFVNQGNGKFLLKRDAFQFARQPQGTFTHAAVADYDRDGRLDIYFCLYSYYLGLDQYHYPAPYFDARNGPPNFLLHNEGNGTFQDRTDAAGLNAENDRYSFACAWGDYNADGAPDLYVANDFGRNNLYRNDGNGKFAAVSAEAGVEDVGAGMSASWFDFDNDGNPDVYVSNMWSAAGIRVSEQKRFHEKEPEEVRALYRQHARGNSLYRNLGNGTFQNVGRAAGVDVGRWAWSSDAWDFDHDGHADLYVANGYISGPSAAGHDAGEVSSFFWRQVVAHSPQNPTTAVNYELGWNAINELIRSDASWNGYERNIFFTNNHDGTFSDISGISGLDLPDDSRSFALADLDHDGRLEIILKNRNGPQVRILRNAMVDIGKSIAIRLRGKKSNRDAIGAAVTVEAEGRRQTKYLQAGSGFLSQHSKEFFFGVGKAEGTVRATIRWPSGLTQVFDHLPVNRRIEMEEGAEEFAAKPFLAAPASYAGAGEIQKPETLPSSVETWLIEPLGAPEFSLPDLAGTVRDLRSFRGGFVLLHFWTTASPACSEQLHALQKRQADSRGRRCARVVHKLR